MIEALQIIGWTLFGIVVAVLSLALMIIFCLLPFALMGGAVGAAFGGFWLVAKTIMGF